MKASKAANTWPRMASFSMNNSCRADGTMACRPVRILSPSCSVALVETTPSRPAASISTGILMPPGKSSRAARAMARIAAATQRTVGAPISRSGRAMSTSVLRVNRTRSEVTGLPGNAISEAGLSARRATGTWPSPRKLRVSQTVAMPAALSGCPSMPSIGEDRKMRSNIMRSRNPANSDTSPPIEWPTR